MVIEISKGLKRTFLINFIVSLVFGILLFFMVDIYLDWFGVHFNVPFSFMGGLFGGALLGYACASFIAWQQTEWDKVKIVVIMEIVWHILGVYIFFWWIYGILANPKFSATHYLYTKIIHLIYLIVFLWFLAAFIFYYVKHEKEEPTARTDSETIQVTPGKTD
ncbi:MAG: hypothetical protein ACFE9Q_09720 [Candidatus Hodarchaeota archaeon]